MILSISRLRMLAALLPLTVRPDTGHINVAWQEIGMDSLVCSTVLLLLPIYHIIQMIHLPHVWLVIHSFIRSFVYSFMHS